jgi:hypothetical protein
MPFCTAEAEPREDYCQECLDERARDALEAEAEARREEKFLGGWDF